MHANFEPKKNDFNLFIMKSLGLNKNLLAEKTTIIVN